jgi:hypothetical protein
MSRAANRIQWRIATTERSKRMVIEDKSMTNGKARVLRASRRFIEVYVPHNPVFIQQAKEKYIYRDRGWWRLDIRRIVKAQRPLTTEEIDRLEKEQAQELLDLVGQFYDIEETILFI